MSDVIIGISKIATALNKSQSIMRGAKKDKTNPFYRSSYSDLSAVFDAIREPFAENGLAITQLMDVLESGRTVLITRLLHTSGEYLESKMLLPDLSDPQKFGSALTYFRRYSLMAIAGVPSEDDDGNRASKPPMAITDDVISEEIYLTVDKFLNGNVELRKKIMEFCGIDDLKKIKVSQLKGVREYATKYISGKKASQTDIANENESD